MSDNQTTNTSGGIGLVGGLFLLFLGLKLIHVIDWSWWWITAPLWIPTALVLTAFALVILVSVLRTRP